MLGLDLGITTYLFLLVNFCLLIISVARIVVALGFTFVSAYEFANVRDVTFSALINETVFIGLNEMSMFILGILAGFKNNIRLMYTFEFLLILLMLTKGLSIGESIRDKDIINEDLQLSLEDMMNEFRVDPKSSPVRSHVTTIQSYFKCCGFNSSNFYKEFDQSCCPGNVTQCNNESAYSQGCSEKIRVPEVLFKIHYFTLFPICEVVLLIMGFVLILFIKSATRRTFG